MIKHLTFILSCFFAGGLLAGEPADFLGIKWGDAADSVRRVMFARPGVTYQSDEAPDQLNFRGGDFAGKDVESWRFTFRKGLFSKASIRLRYSDGGKGPKGWPNDLMFDYFHRMLIQKYGKHPKESADGNHRESLWLFPSSTAPGAFKSILLYYSWFGDRHMDLTYSANPAPRTPIPAVKAKEDL